MELSFIEIFRNATDSDLCMLGIMIVVQLVFILAHWSSLPEHDSWY